MQAPAYHTWTFSKLMKVGKATIESDPLRPLRSIPAPKAEEETDLGASAAVRTVSQPNSFQLFATLTDLVRFGAYSKATKFGVMDTGTSPVSIY